MPTPTPPPPRLPSGGRSDLSTSPFLQQHSVFSPNVGESNFSCCYTSWSSIHRICFHVYLDHYGSYKRRKNNLFLTCSCAMFANHLPLRSAVRRLREMKEAKMLRQVILKRLKTSPQSRPESANIVILCPNIFCSTKCHQE